MAWEGQTTAHPALDRLIADYRKEVQAGIEEWCASETEYRRRRRESEHLIRAAIKEAEGEVAR